MIVNTVLKTVSPFVLVAGSAYRFAKICFNVYNASSPTKAVVAGVKKIVIDCTPPVIEYPLLCAGAIAYGGAACITSDLNFAVGAFECCNAIVKS